VVRHHSGSSHRRPHHPHPLEPLRRGKRRPQLIPSRLHAAPCDRRRRPVARHRDPTARYSSRIGTGRARLSPPGPTGLLRSNDTSPKHPRQVQNLWPSTDATAGRRQRADDRMPASLCRPSLGSTSPRMVRKPAMTDTKGQRRREPFRQLMRAWGGLIRLTEKSSNPTVANRHEHTTKGQTNVPTCVLRSSPSAGRRGEVQVPPPVGVRTVHVAEAACCSCPTS
jgi:hypothetical protein